MLRLRALPFAFVLLLAATAARADSGYVLTYRGAEGCPGREQFIAELGARSEGLHEATGDTSGVSLEVWFEGQEQINGVLLLRDGEGHPTLRVIPGATCEEVVAALALTASLLIDAQRRATPAPAASAPPASTENPAPARSPEPRPPPVAPVDEGSERSSSADEHSTFGIRVGLGVAAEQGVAPSLATAGALDLSVESRGPRIIEPLIGATLERTFTQTVTQAQGEATFRWTALRLGVCPLRLLTEGRLVLRPCGFFEGGALEADGVNVAAPDGVNRPWWAVGASGRLELGLFEPLSALLELGGRLHFSEDRFYFYPDSPATTLFEVPPAGFFGRATVQGGF
jgi:hypothetical protein